MSDVLRQLMRAGVFSALDVHFSRTVAGLVPAAPVEALLALALVSQKTREGHVCVNLGAVSGAQLPGSGASAESVEFPEPAAWRGALFASGLASDGSQPTPLVIDGRDRVYFRRYWEHEQRLAQLLSRRLDLVDEPLHAAVLQGAIARLFGRSRGAPDGQRLAVELAAVRRFVVISGGPGTGKTSTVVKLVALLVEHARSVGRSPLSVALLAPTGKAAARLIESVKLEKSRIGLDPAVRDAIPETASTIHRALGTARGSASRAIRAADRPLRADLVIVDEASMVDIALMRRLVEVVPEQARFVLIGDRHQLASVEAGAVLGDVCGPEPPSGYSHPTVQRVKAVFGDRLPEASGRIAPIADSVVELTRSHRFRPGGGIGELAAAVRTGDGEAALSRLASDQSGEVALCSSPAWPRELRRQVVAGYAAFARKTDPERVLDALESFRVLCAHRAGPAGVEAHNRAVERALESEGLLRVEPRWYPHQPILVVENDYQLELYNGDVGVLLPDPTRARALSAFFRDPGGGLRAFGPSRLPAHMTTFAISVHKSQGSEFDEVAVVLPPEGSPLLTRELLYTAVTRARRRAVLYGSSASVVSAVHRRVERTSGLGDALWPECN